MDAWKLTVPTYYGSAEDCQGKEEFDSPEVPVVIHDAAGVRIVLGTHDQEDYDKPDVQIERRPGGWAVFINPDAGDTCAVVFILDDGRTYCVKELYVPNPLEVVDKEPKEVNCRFRSTRRTANGGESL